MKKFKALLPKRIAISKRILIVALGGLGGVLLAGGGVLAAIAMWPQKEPEAMPPPPPPIVLPEKKGPPEQQQFLAAIEAGRKAYEVVAHNPGKTAMARAARADAICQALNGRIARNWVGTIAQVGVNADKLGTLTIQIGPDVFVKTWNTEAADGGFRTLLPPKEPLYLGAEFLGKYQQVVFSGNFYNSGSDCVSEAHLGIRDAFMEPAFIMTFVELQPILPLVRDQNAPTADAHGKGDGHGKGGDKQAANDKAKPAKH